MVGANLLQHWDLLYYVIMIANVALFLIIKG